MIMCCWKTSWCAIPATYYSLMRCTASILIREYLMILMCSLLRFIMKWSTTKHNEILNPVNKFRCVIIRADSFVEVTLPNDWYASVCRSSLNVNQSVQFAFICVEISDSISYNTYKSANCRKDSSWDLPRSLDLQISRSQLDNLRHALKVRTNKINCNGRKRSETHTYELHNDVWRTHTNWNKFHSGPIRQYTQVDVGSCSSLCEEALSTSNIRVLY